nr:hypothetical protein [Tanacetum cinerariifolium]
PWLWVCAGEGGRDDGESWVSWRGAGNSGRWARDCVCSIGTVEDKILVPKPPKNCAQCTRCGYLVDGPNCQECALVRQELKENLVAHSPDFQNSFEPSNASTNVVNAL